MKSLLVSIIAALFLVGCATAHQGVDLNGKWLGKGYKCWGTVDEDGELLLIEEEISISQDGDKVVATKITGDECVRTGEKTWEGKISGDWIEGVAYGRLSFTSELKPFKARIEIKSSNFLDLELLETLPGDEDAAGLEFVRIPEGQ